MDIKELKKKILIKLSVEWLVTIPSSKINIELDKKYFELMNKVNLPGFRPGKVPKTIIKKDLDRMLFLRFWIKLLMKR